MKIYIVTKGADEGYGIVMATTKKEIAEEWVKKHNALIEDPWENEAEVEEFENQTDRREPLWDVWFEKEQTTVRLKEDQNYAQSGHVTRGLRNFWHVTIEAGTKQEAIKAAADRLAVYKAIDAGIM